jgi:AraC-like DNA-binding protein
MQIHYDVDRIKHILQSLTRLTGISLSFMNTEQEYLCYCCPPGNFCGELFARDPQASRRCWASDRRLLTACKESCRPEGHICHAGLFDAIVPVIKDGTVVGYVVPGRIRVPSSVLPSPYRDDPRMAELWNALPCYDDGQLQSLMELLPNILLGNAIEVRSSDLASEVAAYMEENLSQRMDLEMLCDRFFVSKNTLYRAFRDRFGTTVNQYLTDLRIERAKHLLTDAEMTIAEVAIAVGIEDYHYFCRVFTRHAGIAPGAFRRGTQE